MKVRNIMILYEIQCEHRASEIYRNYCFGTRYRVGRAEVGRELTKCTRETAATTEINYSIKDIECNGCAESVECDVNVVFKGKKRLIAPAMISARNIYHFDLHNHRFST
jgi:hypothetical protein